MLSEILNFDSPFACVCLQPTAVVQPSRLWNTEPNAGGIPNGDTELDHVRCRHEFYKLIINKYCVTACSIAKRVALFKDFLFDCKDGAVRILAGTH